MFHPYVSRAARRLTLSAALFLGLLATSGELQAAPPTEAEIQNWLNQFSDTSLSERTRDDAIDKLARVEDPRAYETLVRASRDASREIRQSAVRGLGRWAEDSARSDEVARITIAAFEDPYYLVRNAAESTAVSLDRHNHVTIGASVLEVLRNTASPGREDAASALGRMRYAPAVPHLIAVAGSNANRNTRSAATRALGNLVSERHEHDLRTPLIRALTDGDYLVRNAAESSLLDLERAGDTDVVRSVVALIDRPGSSIYIEDVAGFLSRSRYPHALDGLLKLVGHSRWQVRSSAVRGFENFPSDPRVLEPTLTALTDSSSSVRDRAIRALEEILEDRYDELSRDDKLRALRALATQLGDSGRYTRRKAAELLGTYLRQHLATVADDSELERRIRACFPSVNASPGGGSSGTHSGIMYVFDVIFFGGLPVLTVADALDPSHGSAPAPTPSSDVPRWPSADIHAFQDLLGQLVQ